MSRDATSRRVAKRKNGEAPDHPTPMTDELIESMLHGDGIPRCKEWESLEAHAREMERRWYVSRQLAITYLKALGGELPK